MEPQLVLLARFDFPYEAHLLKSRLEAEGIPAFIRDEHTIRMNWFYCNAIGGVKVEVPASRLDEALKVSAADFSPELEGTGDGDLEHSTCPRCTSRLLVPITHGLLPTVLGYLFSGLPVLFRRYRIKCMACGQIFKPDEAKVV